MQQGNKCAAKGKARQQQPRWAQKKRQPGGWQNGRAAEQPTVPPSERPAVTSRGKPRPGPHTQQMGLGAKKTASSAVSTPDVPFHTQQLTRARASYKRSDQAYSVPLPERPTPLPPTPTRLGCPP